MKRILLVLITLSVSTLMLLAGNPDRQGEAGASELLMNPWARSAGLHTINTASIGGVEAMRLNPAGVSRFEGNTEIALSHTFYLVGTDISLNAAGIAQKVGKNGAFGISIMAVDVGDLLVTTEDQPEGTGATFSPGFFNIGLSYAHTFENKVSVGVTARGISESTADLQASGFAIDAGVQYVSGENDEFKFGISLRNVGTPLSFRGEGLGVQLDIDGTPNTFNSRGENFELPSVLNIGLSYDFRIDEKHMVTGLANFTANSFSNDQLSAGIEYSLLELFQLRAAYRYTVEGDSDFEILQPVYTGLAAGASVMIPFSKESDAKIAIDYGYRASNPFDGSHSLALKLIF